MRALEDSTTLREVVIASLQAYLFDNSADQNLKVEEDAIGTYGSHIRVDGAGWPTLVRADGDTTQVTEELINEMREELGV